MSGPTDRERVSRLIEQRWSDLDVARTGEHAYAVTLAGAHRLKTVCNLIVGDHTLRVEAFVMRRPEERREELWAYLLRANARMYGVAFAVDAAGDVYLIGRHSLATVTADELDRLLGVVALYADDSFNPMLEIGFGSAIRREWEWRVRRGEPVEHLRAFEYFLAREP